MFKQKVTIYTCKCGSPNCQLHFAASRLNKYIRTVLSFMPYLCSPRIEILWFRMVLIPFYLFFEGLFFYIFTYCTTPYWGLCTDGWCLTATVHGSVFIALLTDTVFWSSWKSARFMYAIVKNMLMQYRNETAKTTKYFPIWTSLMYTFVTANITKNITF